MIKSLINIRKDNYELSEYCVELEFELCILLEHDLSEICVKLEFEHDLFEILFLLEFEHGIYMKY